MDIWTYKAGMYCGACIEKIKKRTPKPAHVDESNELSYDSDHWPKGPTGTSCDTPAHCEECGVFLEADLTWHGIEYLADELREAAIVRRPTKTLSLWLTHYIEFYSDDLKDAAEFYWLAEEFVALKKKLRACRKEAKKTKRVKPKLSGARGKRSPSSGRSRVSAKARTRRT